MSTLTRLPFLRRDRDQERREPHLCGWGVRGEWIVEERGGQPYARHCSCGAVQFWLRSADGEGGEWW